jgi:hypothetical protein
MTNGIIRLVTTRAPDSAIKEPAPSIEVSFIILHGAGGITAHVHAAVFRLWAIHFRAEYAAPGGASEFKIKSSKLKPFGEQEFDGRRFCGRVVALARRDNLGILGWRFTICDLKQNGNRAL